MKNKLFILSLAVLFICAFAFASCSDVQDVNVTPEKAAKVKEVTVVKTSNTVGANYIIASWDAPKNADWFVLYTRVEGQNTVSTVSSSGPNNWNTYDPTTGSENNPSTGKANTNFNADKFNARIHVNNLPKGSIQIGVRTNSVIQGVMPSDITWSKAITARD